jgi:hypothetical protein
MIVLTIATLVDYLGPYTFLTLPLSLSPSFSAYVFQAKYDGHQLQHLIKGPLHIQSDVQLFPQFLGFIELNFSKTRLAFPSDRHVLLA